MELLQLNIFLNKNEYKSLSLLEKCIGKMEAGKSREDIIILLNKKYNTKKYRDVIDGTKQINELSSNDSDYLRDRLLYILKHNDNLPKEQKIIELLGQYNIYIEHIEEVNYSFVRSESNDNLFISGVTTVPIIRPKHLPKYQELFMDTLRSFPEYKRSDKDPDYTPNDIRLIYVLGGFAALANPSSFHNYYSRTLRKKALRKIIGTMKYIKEHMLLHDDTKLQTITDRMMYRLKGMKPVAEAWHRDVMETNEKKLKVTKGDMILDDDEVYGGWINLDSVPQYFSCIPGSHLDIIQKRIRSGFDTLEGTFFRKLEKANPRASKAEIMKMVRPILNKVSAHRQRFEVPPGHMIIFPQYIIHEVVANRAEYDMMRQFTGWRLTRSENALYPKELFIEQAIIPLPGGMIPPMYAQNHIMFFQKKPVKITPDVKYNLIEWSQATFVDEILEHGQRGRIPRYIPSLQSLGLEMSPEYTEEEFEMMSGIPL